MRLRARFSFWFLLVALVPIAVAALVTREVVSRSYRREFARARSGAERTALQVLERQRAGVARLVDGMATDEHDYVGGFLLRLQAAQGEITREIRTWLKERGTQLLSGLDLDVLFLVHGDEVIDAPHHIDAVDSTDPSFRRRSLALAGLPYYARRPLWEDDTIRDVLVVESARTYLEATVVAGREVAPDVLTAVRHRANIDARIVDAGGAVLVPGGGDWPAAGSYPPIRIPLPGEDGVPVAWIEVSISDADLHRVLGEVRTASLLLAAAALLVTTVIAFVIARGITRDLDKLVAGSQAAAREDLDHRVEVKARNEIGELAQAFNLMMANLKTAKERLVIAERVAAWQEMARRLAHEIKNPLTPIQMSVETMRKTWQTQHPSFEETFRESTATILEETARLKRIVGEFSQFARLPKPNKRPCDLNEVIASSIALYEGYAAIKKDLGSSLPLVQGDRDQLAQVVLNLIENARDALGARTDRPTAGEICVSTRWDPGEAFVELAVQDNGPGIPFAARDKLFTPYFTTKQAQGGTGLGLAIVHRIVTDHGGSIAVADVPGGGARFVIVLPTSRSTNPP